MPTVSVVIPTSGRWDFVSTAIRSVRAQAGVDLEVIVVADGRRDGSHETMPALKEPGVRLLVYEERTGVSEARNRGIAAAQGEWVALLDDDDIWSPDKLAVQLEALQREGADFAYAAAVVTDGDMQLRWLEPAPEAESLPARVLENNPIPACSSNLLVRRELAVRVGFDPDLKHFADWDFVVGLVQHGRAVAVPEVLVGYVWHDRSMHLADLRGVNEEFLRARAKHRERGLDLGGPAQSRWLAGNHRQAGQPIRAASAYMRGAVRYRSAPDVGRAIGALLGERVMALAGRPRRLITGPEPKWLALYQ